jgi:UDP-N-acetylglucosamine 4,6-dehydratase
MYSLDGKNILVTGGTGSFGKAIVTKMLLDNKVKKITIYSRDELKQYEMQNQLQDSRIEFILGDIRDLRRLQQVVENKQIIIHAAAMKQIVAAERNPTEAIRTNISGAENVIKASLAAGIEKVIALSTDKAANPINLYGATKLCSDKLFLNANFQSLKSQTKFSVVRYGNVVGSRGSVIPLFLQQMKNSHFTITHSDMTRFWITLSEGVNFVKYCLEHMQGGELFVPKIPSFKIIDVAKVIDPDKKIEIIGVRSGEKMHETMITEDDSYNTFEYDNYYVIAQPEFLELRNDFVKGEKVKNGFRYSSDVNEQWYSVDAFKKMLVSENILMH